MFSKQIKSYRAAINKAHDMNAPFYAAELQSQLHALYVANANTTQQETRDSALCARLVRIQTHGSQQAREHYRSVLAFS